MNKLDLNEIAAAKRAKRRLRKRPAALLPANTKKAEQNAGKEFREHKETFRASHFPDAFHELKRHHAATQKAKECLAAGDLRGAIMAVTAYWGEG